ncbi:MAG: hypothetical protein Q9191_000034 [Dirinaria sp. TL-2023a]
MANLAPTSGRFAGLLPHPEPPMEQMNDFLKSEVEHLTDVDKLSIKEITRQAKLLKDLYTTINAHLKGRSDRSSRGFLHQLHDLLTPECDRPAGAPRPRDSTIVVEGARASHVFPFVYFEPGNQCQSPEFDGHMHFAIEDLKTNQTYKELYENLPRGELAPEVRRRKIEKVDQRWDPDVHGQIAEWQPARHRRQQRRAVINLRTPPPVTTRWKETATQNPSAVPQKAPPISPITPPVSPIMPPASLAPAHPQPLPPPPPPPAPTAPKGRKRKASLPPRDDHPRAAKRQIKYE